jgi:hypothetical protein
MNHECSKILKSKNRGIFRAATKKEINKSDATSNATEKDNYKKAINSPDLIFILQNSIGEYCSADAIKPHELIGKGLDSYVHITSPIRRIVDIINMLEMQYGTVITSKKAEEFIISWLKQINLINIKTKAIRRLQNDVQLLKLYDDKNDNQIYSGMVFARSDIITKNDNTLFKYRVYIPEIKLLTSLTIPHKIINYSMMDFTLHLFLDEIKMNKKVRLQLLYNL